MFESIQIASGTRIQRYKVLWRTDPTQVEYRALSHAMERRVFQRVQLGVCLSAAGAFSLALCDYVAHHHASGLAEKLQAIASPWAEYVHMLCKQYLFDDAGLVANVKFNTKRGRHFQNFASILYCCEDVNRLRTPSAAQLGKWLERPGQPSKSFQSQVERMFSDLLKISGDMTLNKGFTIFSAKVSPVEFVFIGM
jgi:hypothetical protein